MKPGIPPLWVITRSLLKLSTNHPNATGEVTRVAVDAGAEARDLDALQYHPNGGAWPSTMQGYSIPETTRPNTVYRASRCGCGEWVMKN